MKIGNVLPAFIIVLIFIAGCAKDESPAPETTTTTTTVVKTNTVDSTIYFRASINGTQFNLFSDTLYSYAIGDSMRNIPKGIEYKPFSFVVQKNKGTFVLKNSGGIMFVFDTTKVLNNDAYRSLIKVKSYTYGKIARDSSGQVINGLNGARIFFYDTNGVKWASDKASGDQAGSTFSVTEYSDLAVEGSLKKIKANFSCKLYNDLGQVMTVSNGAFSGRIILK